MLNPHDQIEDFFFAVNARMEKGAKEYGNRSFSEDPEKLIREIQEESEDIAGWSFILWRRLKGLENALRYLSAHAKDG